MIVNVCPSGIANAPLDTVWQVLMDTKRYGDWARRKVMAVHPPGPASPGQRLDLGPGFGRRRLATIEIGRMDPNCRWIDMVAKAPLFVNREHVTLSPMDGGRTLVRFN